MSLILQTLSNAALRLRSLIPGRGWNLLDCEASYVRVEMVLWAFGASFASEGVRLEGVGACCVISLGSCSLHLQVISCLIRVVESAGSRP